MSFSVFGTFHASFSTPWPVMRAHTSSRFETSMPMMVMWMELGLIFQGTKKEEKREERNGDARRIPHPVSYRQACSLFEAAPEGAPQPGIGLIGPERSRFSKGEQGSAFSRRTQLALRFYCTTPIASSFSRGRIQAHSPRASAGANPRAPR